MHLSYELVAATLIVGGFILVAILVWRETKLSHIVTLGILAVVSGAVIANLTDITDILISLGGANAHIQRAVNQVNTKAREIEEVRDELRKAVRPLLFAITNPVSEWPKRDTKELCDVIAFAYPDPKEYDAALASFGFRSSKDCPRPKPEQ
jgi:hypothetical protein